MPWKSVAILFSVAVLALPTVAGSKEEERLLDCGVVLKQALDVPEHIPQSLLDKAECVVVIPSVKKAAIFVGGSYGRGAMSCRTGEHWTGPWSAPSMYALEGGSFGLQIGGEATDFILLVVNPRGASSLLRSKVKLGGDVSAALGPLGRTSQADTDIAMRAEILTYSRSQGLFLGVSLDGSTLRPDEEANHRIYGRDLEASEIVRNEHAAAVPKAARNMLAELNKRSPKNLSDPKSLE
ncbi:MAG TPA: lipid-binding SYLF domain-containing protein [Candidatus Acidoferrales bacterium]|nr:lipid-binding SYLF domain-containing protein [Candidatus Acidoferrales bacterium]